MANKDFILEWNIIANVLLLFGYNLRVDDDNSNKGKVPTKKIKLALFISNSYFVLFSVFVMIRSLYTFSTFAFLSHSVNFFHSILFLLIRVVVLYKKEDIVIAVQSINKFIKSNPDPYVTTRRYLLLLIISCFIVPLLVYLFSLAKLLNDTAFLTNKNYLHPFLDTSVKYQKISVTILLLTLTLDTIVSTSIYCIMIFFLYHSFIRNVLMVFRASLRKLQMPVASSHIEKSLTI